MNNTFRKVTPCCLILLSVVLLGLGGCENPGSVGGDIGEPGADIAIDTVSVDELTNKSLNYYSGGFSYFSAGEYQDPLLGNITASGLIKPSRTLGEDDSLTADSKMLMRIILNNNKTYGDSVDNQSFDIYEIDELWRSNAFKLRDTLELNNTGESFTIGDEDSIDVEMPSEWVDKYRQYADTANADSLYRREFFGLALVPTNSNKIIMPSASNTRFVVQNPEADTFSVSPDQWAYMLNRTSANLPQNSVAWHSTYEQILNFDLDLSQINTEASDISKAELVLYQNNELMEESLQQGSPSAERPTETTAQLYLVNPEQLPDNITPGNPVANGTYSSDDEAYHFNMTSQLQNILSSGIPEGEEFVAVLSNDGSIKSSVIYNNQADEEKRPKLIITSLTNNSN